MGFNHFSVLLKESISALNIKKNGVYIDATLGGAGHSECIAKEVGSNGRLICIDKDEIAIQNAQEVLSFALDRVLFARDDFLNIKSIASSMGYDYVDGILFDLGVSSPQLDVVSRGFSYMNDAPLDMRMDNSSSLTAYDVINNYSEDELKKIFYEYGEERYSARISRAIVRQREMGKIDTTLQLAQIIKSSMPQIARHEKQHPAKRVFQAIRIEVNNELDSIKIAVESAIDILRPGGILAIISFHSLEDRIVKQKFLKFAQGCDCPKDFPVCICNKKPIIALVNKKPILPSVEELELNHRSRSAKLRVCKKL